MLVSTTEQRGSRRSAAMRWRWAAAVIQKEPLAQTTACMTPTGQPSRVDQLSTASRTLLSSSSFTSSSMG